MGVGVLVVLGGSGYAVAYRAGEDQSLTDRTLAKAAGEDRILDAEEQRQLLGCFEPGAVYVEGMPVYLESGAFSGSILRHAGKSYNLDPHVLERYLGE